LQLSTSPSLRPGAAPVALHTVRLLADVRGWGVRDFDDAMAEYWPWARSCALKWQKAMDIDDADQEARLALWRCCQSHDGTSSAFTTYLHRAVHLGCYRSPCSQGLVRLPEGERRRRYHVGEAEPRVLAIDVRHRRIARADPHYRQAEQRADAERVLSVLDDRSRDIIERRFGLAGRVQQPLAEIAAGYGLTRERVRQIAEKAIQRMAHAAGADETKSRQRREYVRGSNGRRGGAGAGDRSRV
jgi:RNA polymerase sigma factor (sigma-70 family)